MSARSVRFFGLKAARAMGSDIIAARYLGALRSQVAPTVTTK